MDSLRQITQPVVNSLMSREACELRLEHTREALAVIAHTITNLVTTIPLSFLQGALGGPILMLGAFTFSTSLATVGGSLLGTMWTLSVCAGTAMALLTVIPQVGECVSRVVRHAMWILMPKHMEEQKLQQQAARAVKVILTVGVSAALLAAGWICAPKDFLSLGKRLSHLSR